MKLDSNAHLTYCSNIHPGESWAEVDASLRTYVPRVRQHLQHDGPFGLGLRLSAAAARALRAPEALASFQAWLADANAYVFTLNGFPYGPFHGTTVKQGVYRPDWSMPERVDYTIDLIEILGQLLPEGDAGSISTVPGGFRRDAVFSAPQHAARNLARVAVHCWALARERNRHVCIALEPEPMCMLETTDEAVEFFQAHLFGGAAVSEFVRLTGCTRAEAERAIHEHLGVCFDTCHAAVEFEQPRAAIEHLVRSGIRIAKVQVTAGLEIRTPTVAAIDRLTAFADDTYLHQVVLQTSGGLLRFLDLPEALARWRDGSLPSGPWRVHLHVPVFTRIEGQLDSTATFIERVLPVVRGVCRHYEVETYTWSVLPAALRDRPLAESIAEELRWTRTAWNTP